MKYIKATFLHKIILYLGTNIKQNKPKRGVVEVIIRGLIIISVI